MFPEHSVIPYLTAGDPDREVTLRILHAIHEFSAAIELGIPFSDPMADGKTIQESHQRALKNGFRVEDVFWIVRKFKRNYATPIILMTYYNPVYHQGLENFLDMASESYVDGLLVVDLPVRYADTLLDSSRERGIKTVFLASPNTSNKRLMEIDRAATGFVYLISLYGITGARTRLSNTVFQLIHRARKICKNKLAVGFGVSRRQHVEQLFKEGADGVVVGSALIRLIAEEPSNPEARIREKMRELTGT